MGKLTKYLLPHERSLLETGQLQDNTHQNASSVWLSSPSCSETPDGTTLVYRPMGDVELAWLRETGLLPATQPYQAIIQGEVGRRYAEKFLNGRKKVDTHPSSVVEFAAPAELVERLFAEHTKVEDGALSCGLGSAAGRGLPSFNAALEAGEATWRIVTVKAGPSTRPSASSQPASRPGRRKSRDGA